MRTKDIRITTLADNCVFGKLKVFGEHGLSMFVEVNGHRILFDTGTGRTLLNNAKEIGVELKDAEFIIISHGHGDHMGGLEGVLNYTGGKRVYVGSGAFDTKVLMKNGEYVPSKMKSREDYEAMGAQFTEREQSIELFEDVWLIGPIERKKISEDPMAGKRFRLCKGEYVEETFPEEQALAINTAEGLVLVLGCTHNGLENTVDEAMRVTGAKRLHSIIGGLHLVGVSEKRLAEASEYLRSVGVENMVSCHCTGQRELAIMYRHLGEKCRFNCVGDNLELHL